jgi:hypothetical protein
MNYQFNFKQNSPRMTRHSLPPMSKIGSNFARENSLPGLRQGGFAPSSRIAQQFGRGSSSASTGPSEWNFPVVGRGVGSGSNSPMLSPPPAAAFKAPARPDVHQHLTLKNHCAPSPPSTSPPTTSASLAPTTTTTIQTTSEIVESATPKAGPSTHERRSSWNGKVESWDSFSKVLNENEDNDNDAPTDGSSTPLATGNHSASVEDIPSPASPPHRGLTMKRSTGDLQALRNGGGGLTPPSSHDSSPSPLQRNVALPETDVESSISPVNAGAPLMSPTSTGESSPIDTVPNDSTADLANLATTDDPTEFHREFNNLSYQEFINKFCFFQSPNLVTQELPPVRKNYSHVSGHASPTTGFPFYASQSSQSASTSQTSITSSTSLNRTVTGNENLTPRQEYNLASDAFSTSERSDPATPRAMSRQSSRQDQ